MRRSLLLMLFSLLYISSRASSLEFSVEWFYMDKNEKCIIQQLEFKVISNTEVGVTYGSRPTPNLSIQVDSSNIKGYDLYIPDSISYKGRTFAVTTIYPGAFRESTSSKVPKYTSAYLPNTLKYIKAAAFESQDKIKKIVVPNSVTEIEDKAFCSSEIKEFVLGNSVKTVKTIFSDKRSAQIEKFICLSVTPPYVSPLQSEGIGYIGSKVWCDLIVPKGCINAYKRALYWKDFAVIYELDSLTYIPEGYTCEAPTIEYKDGAIYYTDIPEDAQVITKISADDSKETNTSTVELSRIYHISAYTARPGWNNSEISEATLVYAIDNDDTGVETISIKTTPLFIKSDGNTLSVYGLAPGQNFAVYSVDGTKIYSSVVTGNLVNLDVKHLLNKTIILKVNNRTAKYFVKE